MDSASSTQHPAPPAETDAPSRRARFLRLSGAGAVLAADLWSKHLVFYPHVLEEGYRPDHAVVVGEVASWWRTILVYNQGVTFGLLSGVPMWVKSLFTLGVIAWLGVRLWRAPARSRLEPVALAMIVGGAVGNLYDRALRPFVEPDTNPGVRDFLDWYAPPGTWLAGWLTEHGITTHWYTSNVADVCIVVGVGLLAIVLLREKDPEAAPPASPAAQSPAP